MLPEILNSRTPEQAAGLLQSKGVDPQFISDIYNKFGKRYGGKVGLDGSTMQNAMNVLTREMGKGKNAQKRVGSAFDKSKYPKL